MLQTSHIVTCLSYDTQAEEAANFYVGVFPGSRVISITRYTDAGQEFHRRKPGSVLTVEFEILATGGRPGHRFMALNGGPKDKFNQSISFQVMCDTQQEIDRYWDALTADGGQPIACSWLTDKYGMSWQIVPRVMMAMLADAESPAGKRAMTAMMGMVKLDIAELERAYAGK